MKHLLIGAVMSAALLGAVPASAQVVVKEKATVGVGVHRTYNHHWRHRHHRAWRSPWRSGYSWRSGYASCEVVRIRTRLPNGKIVIRTRRSC